MKKVLGLIVIFLVIIIDCVLVFKYNHRPFIAISKKIDNGRVYYSLGYKVLSCDNEIDKKMPWWQKGNCDSVLDAPKFYVEIKKADICIDDDNFSVYYDRKTNINYYVSCIDAIYVIDNKTQEKYTLSDVQEQELFPIKELLQMINDQVPVKEAQVTTETGFNINIMDQCDLDIKNIYNQNNQKIYTNCLSVSYDEMSLSDALNSHTIDLKHIYEYIDHTSKYAEAIKDSELDGRFIYKNLLYSIVACDKNTLVYTPLDNHDDYQVCQVIK